MKTTKQGVITKKLDQRTAVVETFRMKSHPIYKKRFKVVKKFLADDKDDKFKAGDIVSIQECRPISKTKRFEIVSKVGSTMVGEDKIAGEEILGAEKPAEVIEVINTN
jgi:small subunit ribosomal protein S17